MNIAVPVSIGEIVDKLSILKIKQIRIKDAVKLENINREHNLLHKTFMEVCENLPAYKRPQIIGLSTKLKNINEVIWDIEDNIRNCERNKNFGPEFIELARGVYYNNDERAALKRAINNLVGSNIMEEKSYTDYVGAP